MTVSIGATFSTTALTAQPFGYEGEARTGLTARTFALSGLLMPAQWQALVAEYDSWRSQRIQDEDTLKSGVVGTTISLSITSANGLSVSGLACWFADPPKGEQVGAYINASCVLVDAAQALAVLLRTEEKQKQNSEKALPNLGTVSLGNATVTLTKPMGTRRDGPNVAMTATGVSYVTGPLVAHKLREIEGYISNGTYDDLLTWYDSTIAAVPQATSWFPVSPPTATAEVVVTGGVKSTRYNVQVSALQIL